MATTKKTTKKPSTAKTAVKAAKCAKSAADRGVAAGTRKLKIKIPKEAIKTIKQVANDFGIDFTGAANLMLTVNMMRAGVTSKTEYARGVKELVAKYGVAKEKLPAYIKGGDPEEVKRFEAFCAKNSTVAKTDSKEVSKVMSSAAKAVTRGKMTVTNDTPAKKGKRTVAKAAKKSR